MVTTSLLVESLPFRQPGHTPLTGRLRHTCVQSSAFLFFGQVMEEGYEEPLAPSNSEILGRVPFVRNFDAPANENDPMVKMAGL